MSSVCTARRSTRGLRGGSCDDERAAWRQTFDRRLVGLEHLRVRMRRRARAGMRGDRGRGDASGGRRRRRRGDADGRQQSPGRRGLGPSDVRGLGGRLVAAGRGRRAGRARDDGRRPGLCVARRRFGRGTRRAVIARRGAGLLARRGAGLLVGRRRERRLRLRAARVRRDRDGVHRGDDGGPLRRRCLRPVQQPGGQRQLHDGVRRRCDLVRVRPSR